MTKTPKKSSSTVLEKVDVSRRGFVKSLTIGTAFVVPFVASYSMDGLRTNMAHAGQSYSSNQHHGIFGFIRFLIHKIFRSFGPSSK